MSKVISQIGASITGKRGVVTSPVSQVSFEQRSKREDFSIGGSYRKEYDIAIKFGYRVWLDENASVQEETHALRKAKYAVADYIFGEFREPLHNLYMALNRHEFEKANAILYGIERQMFDIEENDNEVN